MNRRSIHPVLQGGPLLIAHRGGSALMPENTLTAFQHAADCWQADMIELDVRASADGHCVVIHDAAVDRTTNGSGLVAHMTLRELQQLDAGHHFTPDGGATFPWRGRGAHISTIDEVFTALPHMRFTVELKSADAQEPLFRAVAAHQLTDRVIAAGERNVFRTMFGAYRGAKSASLEEALPFFLLHRCRLARLGRVPADVIQTCEIYRGRRIVSPRLVADLHRAGVLVHVWTVNETADMERLLDWGVDGLVTDRPDRLAELLHRRLGRPLPPGLPS
jgi:glycerophosphoryl diester phosphodiesterase